MNTYAYGMCIKIYNGMRTYMNMVMRNGNVYLCGGMRMHVNMKWEMAMYIYVVLVNVTEWILMHMVCVWKIYNGMRTYMNMEWEMVMYMCMRNMNM